MSVINVNLDLLERKSDSIINLARTLQSYNKAVDGISLKLSMNILAQSRLDFKLREVHDQILNEAARMETLGNALVQVARSYKTTEAKLVGLCDAKSLSEIQNGSQINLVVNRMLDKIAENLRYLLVSLGILKSEKQERIEGVSVSERQEHEMDLYMQQQVAELNKNEHFSDENWKKASVSERKAILQDYITHISTIMGLPSVAIRWEYSQAEDGYATMGYYSSGNNSVTINEWVLSEGDENGFSSYGLVSTVVHEMRHYYQQEVVRNPDKYVVSAETIQEWENSFNNYKSTEEFMEEYGMSRKNAHKAYQDQAIESDARWFAKQK